jgi:hypothetical protein
MFESEEYTEYVLDRRLACQQLGMHLPARVNARKIAERYMAPWTGAGGILIWSPYFERPYIPGNATDKVPCHRFAEPDFALRFARLLGVAAAANVIVGRSDAGGVLFDDGDEVMVEDSARMPLDIIVADQTGTFNDYDGDLRRFAAGYAEPVNRRLEFLPDARGFAGLYLDTFLERFLAIQQGYRDRKRAFHTLFKNRPYDKGGSFLYRWEQILGRLDRTDPRELRSLIAAHLR